MNKLSSKSIIALTTFFVALSLLATTVTISPEIFAQTNLSSMQPSANISQDSTGPPPSSIQLPKTQHQVDLVTTSQPCLETKADRTPQQTEGPYFVDEMLNRSDIRSDPSDGSVQDGIPLRLIIHIHDFGRNGSCTPLKGAYVDIWHANSQGLYSDIQQAGTEGKKYLRGFQVTDDNGTVQFTTIYPGWYQGRTVHIHIKVHTLEGSEKSFDWTSQLYFNDSITDEVHTQDTYSHHGFPDPRNSQDGIYTGSSLDGLVQDNSGTRLMLNLNKDKQGSYLGIFDVVLDSGQQQPAQ